jgi:hypothetical protein
MRESKTEGGGVTEGFGPEKKDGSGHTGAIHDGSKVAAE